MPTNTQSTQKSGATPKQAKDNTLYTRQQKGHSIILWGIMCMFILPIPIVIYYTKSPNHYWHA